MGKRVKGSLIHQRVIYFDGVSYPKFYYIFGSLSKKTEKSKTIQGARNSKALLAADFPQYPNFHAPTAYDSTHPYKHAIAAENHPSIHETNHYAPAPVDVPFSVACLAVF